MTVADYRNLRADQKNNDIVASQMASVICTCLLRHMRVGLNDSAHPWRILDPWCPVHADGPNVPLTRTKGDRLTRMEGE